MLETRNCHTNGHFHYSQAHISNRFFCLSFKCDLRITFSCVSAVLNYKGKNERASVFFQTNLIIHACQKLKQSFIIWWVFEPLFVSLNTVFGSFAAIIVENLCRKLSLKYFPSGSSIAQLFSWRAHFSRVGWTNEHRAAWMGPTWQTRERNFQVTVLMLDWTGVSTYATSGLFFRKRYRKSFSRGLKCDQKKCDLHL